MNRLKAKGMSCGPSNRKRLSTVAAGPTITERSCRIDDVFASRGSRGSLIWLFSAVDPRLCRLLLRLDPPAAAAAKEAARDVVELKKGDKVITVGGFTGRSRRSTMTIWSAHRRQGGDPPLQFGGRPGQGRGMNVRRHYDAGDAGRGQSAPAVDAYIRKADDTWGAIGFTEHGHRHVELVPSIAQKRIVTPGESSGRPNWRTSRAIPTTSAMPWGASPREHRRHHRDVDP